MTNCASRQHANDATRLRAPMPAWRLHASAASWPATRWSCSTATAARGNRRGAASIISRIEGFTGPSFLHDLPPWVAWVVGRGYAPDAAKIGLLWSIVVMPSARSMGRAHLNPSVPHAPIVGSAPLESDNIERTQVYKIVTHPNPEELLLHEK